jgi:ABC-type branched-subunit amino acid transport system substrate-binding protein
MTAGTQAAVDAINANGGVDGHKISMSFCEDGSPISDPDSTANCGTSAASAHDLAAVGVFTTTSQDLLPTLQKAKIPDLSLIVLDQADLTSPASFPLIPGNDVGAAALGVLLMQQHCVKPAVIDQAGNPSDALYESSFTKGVEYSKGTVGPILEVPTTQFSFTATIAQIEESGSTCVAVDSSTQQMIAIYQAIQSSGKALLVAANETLVDAAVISTVGALANGTVLVTNLVPLAEQTTDQKHAEEQITKYQGAADVNGFQLLNWETVYVFAAAANDVIKAKEAITSANIWKAMNKLNFNMKLAQPLDFAKKGPIPGEPRGVLTGQYFEHIVNGQVLPLSKKLVNLAPALEGKRS